ncbi:MAG: sugar phosphate isomerase/epimerase [Chloroflexi bacterium]|nr:sugar phosphate isomerase/epimerase [Chloroflexota bacterium]MBU1746530.1 sugar phosphate isomerase/epimerase [Chloroflexota bacterium]
MYLGARTHSLDDIEFLARAGFDFAELDWKDPVALKEILPALAALQDQYGIDYLAHGPNERNPFDVDEIIQVLGPTVCDLLDLAPGLDITRHTQHLWLDPRFMSAPDIARKLDLLETWLEHADRAGVTLCIENLSEHADHFAPAFQRLPALCMTLDVGHAEILSRPNASFAFVARLPDRIRHVHLHDNHGGDEVKDDLHLPIGQGSIDVAGILGQLRVAGYAGGFSFEIPLPDAAQSRQAIRTMWGE